METVSLPETLLYVSLGLTFLRAVLQNVKPITDATPGKDDDAWRARIARVVDAMDGTLDSLTVGPSDLRLPRKRR